MTSGVMVSATWADRRPLAELEKAIASRVRTLSFETTERAVKAVSIQALRSMRAETAVAPRKNPPIIDGRWNVSIMKTQYVSGWARPGRNGYRGRRVIRAGRSAHALDTSPNGNRVVNLAGPFMGVGEAAVQVYALTITERPATKPFYNSLILATSRDIVWKFARKRIVRRIGQYRGVSKRLLGLAMHKIAAGQGESSVGDRVGRLANAYCNVNLSGDGFNSGHYSVSVLDDLPKSALAMRHGYAGMTLALKRASNSVLAAISKTAMRTGFGDTWQTPFPEIAKK